MKTSSCTLNSVTGTVFNSKLAKQSIDRLKYALKKFDCVADIEVFRNAFHDKFHTVSQQPGYADLLAAMLCSDKLAGIERLALIVDENLPWGQVIQRRKSQAEALSQFIRLHTPALAIPIPKNLLLQCMHLVDLVQPLAIAEDKYAANFHDIEKAKAEGRLPAKFHEVYENLVINKELRQAYVYQALALHFLADEVSLTRAIWRSRAWEILILEVGTVATRWVNTGEPAKTWRGIIALSAMSQMGEVYAGHQLAQSLFFKADAPRIDKRLALDIIEQTFEQYMQRRNHEPVFACPMSEIDLFRNYNTIVSEAIRNCDESEEIFRLTQNLLTVLLEGAERKMEGFAACVLCILTPDFLPLQNVDPENERLFSLRHKISGYPTAEAYCRQLADTTQVKRFQARFY